MALTSLFPAQGLQSFIDESLVQLTATNGTPGATQFRSSVVNRAPITDISQNLKVSMGIERVMVQQLIQLQNEFGPNGEPVWSALNDDRGSIRFVGNWASGPGVSGSDGPLAFGQSVGDYCEITFYGTALNVLTLFNSGTRDWRASVDGGTEGANIWPSSGSNVLQQRNYMMNTILPVVGGLALGLHTVKIRNAVGTLIVEGFEVINESTTIKTNPGSAFVAGKRLFLSAQDSQSPTSGFTNTFGSAGTKGGHVLQYLASDGTVKKDIQYVDATAQFLTSADHTNEEMVRQYSPREFGAGRSDDFSALARYSSAGSAAFTLDDGTTSLVASSGFYSSATGEFRLNTTGDFITISFVGTGLDIILKDNAAAVDAHSVTIDGSSAGSLTGCGTANISYQRKIISGLPYGTHTIKITRSASALDALTFKSFVVYQPKKPSLPAGAVELADYNVMATYVANTVFGDSTIGSGTLRKTSTRELTYVGTWSGSLNVPVFSSGWLITSSAAAGNSLLYTFFGTGFDFRFDGPTSANLTVTVDGSTNLSAFSASTYGGTATFTGPTGIIAVSAGANAMGAVLSGLTLGVHTVKITTNNTIAIDVLALDIITPIHSVKSNTNADLQNTLAVGSCAISDNRKTSPIKDASAQVRNWSQAVSLGNSVSITSSTDVPMTDMSVVIKTSGRPIEITFNCSVFNTAAGGYVFASFYVNGSVVGVGMRHREPSTASNQYNPLAGSVIVPVPAGTHKIDIYWNNSGTGTAVVNERIVAVKEI